MSDVYVQHEHLIRRAYTNTRVTVVCAIWRWFLLLENRAIVRIGRRRVSSNPKCSVRWLASK